MKYVIEFNLIYNNHIKSLFFYKKYTDKLSDYQIDFEVENLALILEKECKFNIIILIHIKELIKNCNFFHKF